MVRHLSLGRLIVVPANCCRTATALLLPKLPSPSQACAAGVIPRKYLGRIARVGRRYLGGGRSRSFVGVSPEWDSKLLKRRVSVEAGERSMLSPSI
jgi:hypothetical protein